MKLWWIGISILLYINSLLCQEVMDTTDFDPLAETSPTSAPEFHSAISPEPSAVNVNITNNISTNEPVVATSAITVPTTIVFAPSSNPGVTKPASATPFRSTHPSPTVTSRISQTIIQSSDHGLYSGPYSWIILMLIGLTLFSTS
ncbi:hypothetical protein K7432_001083 [Basidiobolus ranarum]|uniref:Uncharacterized protein n=1 Tax=Basidiobolus ranarum TaxID=34480 RepID=A0ABR2X3J1_9FUNG